MSRICYSKVQIGSFLIKIVHLQISVVVNIKDELKKKKRGRAINHCTFVLIALLDKNFA